MIYETPNLIVRLFEAKDAADRYEWRRDPEVARYDIWEPQSLEEVIAQMPKLAAVNPEATNIMNIFAVELKENGKVIGDVCLKVNSQDKQAEIGYT